MDTPSGEAAPRGVHEAAMDMIQRRRDHQAGGRPLWTIDLVPGQLGDGGWTMFACHAPIRT